MRKLAGFLLTVLIFASMFFAGSPETSILIGVVVWAYSVLVIPGKELFNRFLHRTSLLTGIGIIALGLSAIQIIPTSYLIKESVRSEGLNAKESTKLSMSPPALSALIIPENNFGLMSSEEKHRSYFLQSCFMGLIPLGILLTGLFSGIKSRAYWFWATLFFVGIFFSMGRFNPLYSLVFEWIPLFKLFRYPEKFFFLSAFSLVFLVGLGLDVLGGKSSKIRPMPILLAAFFLLILLIWTALLEPDRKWGLASLTLFLFTAIFYSASVFKCGEIIFKILVVMLLALELFANNISLVPITDRSFYEKKMNLLSN